MFKRAVKTKSHSGSYAHCNYGLLNSVVCLKRAVSAMWCKKAADRG